MQTYKYKDKRIKYYYMLLLPLLYMLQLSDPRNAALIVIIAVPCIIVLLFAIAGLRERISFENSKVCFIRLKTTLISLDTIQSIKVCNQGDLCYEISYGNTCKLIWKLSFYESDEDISIFRSALAELIGRAREANPEVLVDDHCMLASDGESEYAGKQASMAYAKRAALVGLGGWLAYIIIDLIVFGLGSTQSIIKYMNNLFIITGEELQIATNLVYVLLYLADILLIVISLVLLLKKKVSFRKAYLYYLMYVPLLILVTSCLGMISTKQIDALYIGRYVAIPAIANVGWYFAWKEYLARSIRVKNTLGAPPPAPILGELKGRSFLYVIAILFPLIGFIVGFVYSASKDPGKQVSGKKMIKYSLISCVVYLLFASLMNFVNHL